MGMKRRPRASAMEFIGMIVVSKSIMNIEQIAARKDVDKDNVRYVFGSMSMVVDSRAFLRGLK